MIAQRITVWWVVVSFIGLCASGCRGKAESNDGLTAVEVARSYAKAWVGRNWKEMRGLMSEKSQARVSVEQLASEVAQWESVTGHPVKVLGVKKETTGLTYKLLVIPGTKVRAAFEQEKGDRCIMTGQCTLAPMGNRPAITSDTALYWLTHEPPLEVLKRSFDFESIRSRDPFPCLDPRRLRQALHGQTVESTVFSYLVAWQNHDLASMLRMLAPELRTEGTERSFAAKIVSIEDEYYKPVGITEIGSASTTVAVLLELDGTGTRWEKRRGQGSLPKPLRIVEALPLVHETDGYRIDASGSFLRSAPKAYSVFSESEPSGPTADIQGYPGGVHEGPGTHGREDHR